MTAVPRIIVKMTLEGPPGSLKLYGDELTTHIRTFFEYVSIPPGIETEIEIDSNLDDITPPL